MADEDDDKDLEEREDDGDDGEASSAAVAAGSSASDDDDGDAGSDDAGSDDAGSDDDERVARRERAQIEREERQLAEGAEAEAEASPISTLMGIERWVQFSFIALSLAIFYVTDKLVSFAWSFAAEPDSTIVSGSAALIGLVGAYALYRHPTVNQLAHEVVGELAKVTWPTRDETYYSTVVVIVTSLIAALYTGVFDALWSAFTDLIYNV